MDSPTECVGRKRKRVEETEEAVEVTLTDVPAYLQGNQLYRSLKENEVTGDEAVLVAVSKKCSKPDGFIDTNADLDHLLEVEDVPDSVYSNLVGSFDPPKVRQDLLHNFPVVRVLQFMLSSPT